MKIAFVTTNKHKFSEASSVLTDFDIELEQLDVDYPENHDAGIETIARESAIAMLKKYSKPLILEDTALFFKAYPGFPGALPKFVFDTLGFRGIFKLLENENREAYFQTIAAFIEPGGKPILFEAAMEGEITEEIINQDMDVMGYDKIFVPKGSDKTLSEMTQKEKNILSMRGKVFRKFGEFIENS